MLTVELPPRARRILAHRCRRTSGNGTTSACAENTNQLTPGRILCWNYLRVRGEYLRETAWAFPSMELPPRARRIHFECAQCILLNGTTSACAENTGGWGRPHSSTRNYLRVRGEYFICYLEPGPLSELPPRARRIPLIAEYGGVDWGTTSACAENTCLSSGVWNPQGNYLRVRGEYPK